MSNEEYMKRAIALAKRGAGWTTPNPLVGAVIVKDGRIIGEGYHAKYGELHAERNALANATESVEGATMYVTLEPCCHHGKQPPCTEAIIEAGIAKVIVGSSDPNPLVAGKGIEILREHGIEVETGFLEKECDQVAEVFHHYMRTKLPFVVLKYAMTLDGKIAAYTGASQWITGETARNHVHQLRHRYAAIMVGVGTVLADDPMLTARIENGNNPIRIVCDTNLRTPLDAKVVTTAKEVSTIFATCCQDMAKQEAYRQAGCQVMVLPEHEGHVDIKKLMEALGAMGIDSLLIEGGGTLAWAAVKAGIINLVDAYVAPKILGGKEAKSPVEGQGAPHPDQGLQLKVREILPLGDDILIESEVKGCSQEL